MVKVTTCVLDACPLWLIKIIKAELFEKMKGMVNVSLKQSKNPKGGSSKTFV